MADLAFGAVHSLLGLLRDEAQALVRLGDDVQFIREEMESMNSFLLHLVQTTPPSGEHEGPVRAWMKQVRDLAFDCTNCVDLYVLHGRGSAASAARYNASSWGFLGYLLSMPCNVPVLWAQRQAAAQIRELKARARDVGERRQRYGVELPKITSQQLRIVVELPKTDGGGGGDESATEAAVTIEDAVAVVSDDFIRRVVLAFPEEPSILEECTQDLVRELITINEGHKKAEAEAAAKAPPPPHPIKKVVGIVAPDKDLDGGDLARKALENRSVDKQFRTKVWFTVDYAFLCTVVGVGRYPEAGAWYVLREILDKTLPAKQEGEIADRDGWDEDRIAAEITEGLGMKGKRSLIVIEGFHAVKEERVWERMEHALSKFGCAAGSAVIVITKDIHDANKLIRGPNGIIITYSLAYFFFVKASVVVDRGFKEHYLKNILWDILRRIQERCERQAFCMKMFVHYLYANPNRTKEELDKLLRVLISPESSLDGAGATKLRKGNAKNLLYFCYDDLPRTYKACLLYLAIFPPDEKISRSRLVGRWIVEGLIIGRDMPHAVREAERCFDALLKRWLVIPGDIGATGKVKSCIVKHDLVKEFIAKKAREEQFLDPRLSRHLAQHFSVHGDLRLRRSDNITKFLRSLRTNSRADRHTSSQLMLLNVLDLEGSPELRRDPSNWNLGKEHFMKNQHRYLKNIFSKIHMLKYLSLRNTDVTELPKEINKLMLLEILDIRQTWLPSSATKYILLPRLKRLLAGRTEISSTDSTRPEESLYAVQIPRDIGKMVNMEVLSHVEALQDADNLIDIGQQLWQLRKLGVVINDNEDRLKNLLQAISDLNECLQSLSIRIQPSGKRCASEIKPEIAEMLKNPPELLESLSISGITCTGMLPLLVSGLRQLAKVTLHKTRLNQNDLRVLGKLANLRCVRLRHESYTGNDLTFNKDEFQNLLFLVVECSKITSICFNDGAAPKLEKITCSFTLESTCSFTMESLPGIDKLPVLKRIEFNGVNVHDQVRKAIEAYPKHPVLILNPPQNQGQGTGSAAAAAPSNTA